MRFKEAVWWITGASSGIGRALAIQAAERGVQLVLTARNKQALQEVKAACEEKGVQAIAMAADLADESCHANLIQEVLAGFGRVDAVIHSAGVTQRALFKETDMAVHRRLMEINYFAPLSLTKLLLPHFSQKSDVHVVVLSSMAGLMGFPMRSGYAASKHALKGAFETMQSEDLSPNLKILIVSPGRIRTPISLHALKGDGSAHGQMDKGQQEGIPVEECAARIITAMERGKRHLLIARSEKLLWWLWWWARPIYYRIASKAGQSES